MSLQAVNWALAQPLPDPGTKLVLVLMANLASATHEAYPGVHYLAERSGQTVDKVREDVAALRVAHLIADSGIRIGRGRRGTRWRLGVTGPVTDYVDPI